MISDVVQNEGTGQAPTDFVFKVSLTAPSGAQPVTVAYQTFNGTAESGNGTAESDNSDFTPVKDAVTFAPGETEKFITVLVGADAHWEYPEFFQVYLTNATNAVTAKSQAVGVVINDG